MERLTYARPIFDFKTHRQYLMKTLPANYQQFY